MTHELVEESIDTIFREVEIRQLAADMLVARSFGDHVTPEKAHAFVWSIPGEQLDKVLGRMFELADK